ncbi:DUF4349 domain-containing protein [Microbispora sp. GKU 823]|uniref:DUF4349 domain-containing protein n=1 Tax=Microbispora sp. GKU 823 TaxID=1652100 RepID=UPI0009A3C6DA|nr:DUF4349 domain-containing protein [Microbispora sp. GKU 823]OPG10439.1 hypothetical protein B1L11_23780 [Microbispora sp. GKU 823]
MRRIRYGAAALVAVAFLLTGCGGSGESSSDTAGSAAAPVAPAGEAATAGAMDQGEERAPATGGATGGQEKTRIEPADRAIIYQAELTVEAKDVTAAADRAKAIVTGAGGYVAEERSESVSRGVQSMIAFKVPPARYADVLAQLGRDLGKRTFVRQNAQDVTEEVADVASRVKSAEAALGQFRTLLSKANKIGEILEIEREISSREADLESLQARQKALEAQTGMATVTLTLVPPPEHSARAAKKEEATGFLAGLRAGWDTLTASTVMALTVLGALLPWIVVAGVVWLAVRVVMRRMRRRAAPPAGPVPPGAVPPGSVPPVPPGRGPGFPAGPAPTDGPAGQPRFGSPEPAPREDRDEDRDDENRDESQDQGRESERTPG